MPIPLDGGNGRMGLQTSPLLIVAGVSCGERR